MGDNCKSVMVILVAAQTQILTSQSKAHFYINIFHPGTLRLQPWTMLLQPSSPANIPGSSFVDALLSLPRVCQGAKKKIKAVVSPSCSRRWRHLGEVSAPFFEITKGLIFQTVWGLFCFCSRFLKSGASETNERWRCFVLFLLVFLKKQ